VVFAVGSPIATVASVLVDVVDAATTPVRVTVGESGLSGWEKAAAIATCVAAGGTLIGATFTAVAAFAARNAARAIRDTSRDAREGLALGIRPRLNAIYSPEGTSGSRVCPKHQRRGARRSRPPLRHPGSFSEEAEAG
jgi:hypothetical protein